MWGCHFRAALSQLGSPSLALSFARVSSHLSPASSACPCCWLVAGCEQFSVSQFLRFGFCSTRLAHSGVPTVFQRESWMSSHCNIPSFFTGNDVVLEVVQMLLCVQVWYSYGSGGELLLRPRVLMYPPRLRPLGLSCSGVIRCFDLWCLGADSRFRSPPVAEASARKSCFRTVSSVVCRLFGCLSRPEPFVLARFLKRFCAQNLCLKGVTVAAQLETLFYTCACLHFFCKFVGGKKVEAVLWRRTWFLHCVLCLASAGNLRSSLHLRVHVAHTRRPPSVRGT